MRKKLARVVPRACMVGVLALLACASGCASLEPASCDGDLPRVQKLLAGGANPNDAPDRVYPLCGAILYKRYAVIDALLKAGAKPDITCQIGYRETTPLQLAADHHSLEIIERLLATGATPLESDFLLKLIMEKSEGVAPRPECKHRGHAVAKVLLDYLERTQGREKVHAFVTTQVDGNHFLWPGWSPLAAAAKCGDNQMLRVMLAHGVNPNVYVDAGPIAGPGAGHWPVIYFALFGSGGKATAKLLVAGGARPLKTKEGMTFEEAAKVVAAFEAHQEQRREQFLADLHAEMRASEREEKQRREAMSRAAFEDFQRSVNTNTTWDTHTPLPTIASRSATPARQPATPVANSEPTPEAPPSASSTPSSVPSSEPARDCHDEPNERSFRTIALPSRSEAESNLEMNVREIVCFGDYTLRDRNCVEMHQPVFDVVDSKLIRRPDKILYQCSATAICARPKRVCAERSPEQSGAVRQ